MHTDHDVSRHGFEQRAFEKGDHRGENRCARWRSKGKVASGLFLLIFTAGADAEPGNAWRLLLEPKFMHRQVAFEIPHAQRTVLAPVRLIGDDYVFPTRAEFETLNIDWPAMRKLAATEADAQLAGLRPRYVRARNKVIAYAEVHSERPIIASAVLAPHFLGLFKDTLGEKVLVVVPNRFTAFLFAGLASDYQQYAPMIFEAYHATPFPVSTEVFELSADGLKAIGAYEEP